MPLAYAILAHEPFSRLRPLLDCLTDNGDIIVLHYDLATPHANDIELIKRYFPKVILAERVRVEWGESSIVFATLNCLRALQQAGANYEYVTLLSGSCFPVKGSTHIEQFLHNFDGAEFIEAVNVEHQRWITEGIQQERWQLPHWCNWRHHPKWFSWSIRILSWLGVKRRFPLDCPVHMGSQWWTLSHGMVEKILTLCEQTPELLTFLKHTWIPDEFFFQTLVAHLIKDKSNIHPPLMNYRFNCKGIPKTYSINDLNELVRLPENKCFTRKIQARDEKFVSLFRRVYLNQMPVPEEINIVAHSKVPDNLRWYKRECLFSDNLDQLPVPCSVLIWHKGAEGVLPGLYHALSQNMTDMGVFANLFAADTIGYGKQPPLPGYEAGDTSLRDYDRMEFIQQLCLRDPKGIVFLYQFSVADKFLKAISSASQVQLLEVFAANDNQINDFTRLEKEQVESRWQKKHVAQFTSDNIEGLCRCITAHQQASVFYQALNGTKDYSKNVINGEPDGKVKHTQ
ncbi:beta-1,6-N-acetylglucosaminyltransferase [Thalassotalea mangrovi]|uniref:Peptide O-xylosyltransferase n=1 Tax=Thalassotalea mangrovi TaxID=2572245 RepID=A0A4V5NUG1_9GAMM|nr:beta-1,6-N-acetylglucosaminyltransferase [Thalassotalea mangrovi]TKB45175.1 hypothetical protein E8M12_10135 [Thalassotalea mangrovi]